jgi:hypothetical protein
MIMRTKLTMNAEVDCYFFHYIVANIRGITKRSKYICSSTSN